VRALVARHAAPQDAPGAREFRVLIGARPEITTHREEEDTP